MTMATATTDRFEELVPAASPVWYQTIVGSSGAEAFQRWRNPVPTDTTSGSFAVDLGIRQLSICDQDRELFLRLVEQWHVERVGAASSMAEMIACPSYLRIIGMGLRALPLIMEHLEREGDEPDHWCAALEAITGENPVREDAHGDTVRIADAWIEWNQARVAWSFPASTTRTIESPATRVFATTV